MVVFRSDGSSAETISDTAAMKSVRMNEEFTEDSNVNK